MSLEIGREVRFGVSVITDREIESLHKIAISSPKKRAILTLQRTQDEGIDRIVLYILPETYLRPYKYVHSRGIEMLFPRSGVAELLTFSDEGKVERREVLKRDIVVCDVEPNVFRTIVAKAPFAVLELSTQPLVFRTQKERIYAPWAPKEGSPEAERYLEGLKSEAS